MKSRKPTQEFEIREGHPDRWVIGVDEVGRGCLAGPVVTAAVALPLDSLKSPPDWVVEVRDSKLLSPEKRERLFPLVQAWVREFSINEASVEEIDRLNIYHAVHLSMSRSVNELLRKAGMPTDYRVLVDGNRVPAGLRAVATPIVKGDLQCLSIACASILAKVHRDRMMEELDRLYPGYGFGVHKAYATPEHRGALAKLGASPVHRRSFAPVAASLKVSQASLPGLNGDF